MPIGEKETRFINGEEEIIKSEAHLDAVPWKVENPV